MSYFHSIVQDVQNDPNNSSSANINAGATYTGASTSSLGIAGIQVNLKTDQNCTIYVDQSMDNTNWDITDSFNYLYSLGGNSWTVQATASYLRIRVKNIGPSNTTYCRIQTNLCPIVEALPRSLDENEHLQTAVHNIKDTYGFQLEYTPFGEMRTITPYRLVGATFDGTILDNNFWTSAVGTGGSVAVGNGQAILSTGTTANNSVNIQSVRSARFVGGASNRSRSIIRLPDTGTANNVRRWGMFTTTDGAFFELSGTSLNLGTRKTGVDTKVLNGAFNGDFGTSLVLDTNVHAYEIYVTPYKLWFSNTLGLIHTIDAATTTWTDTLNLPSRIENFNINGGTANVSLQARLTMIHRLGHEKTAPIWKHLTAATAQILKFGPGKLHKIIFNTFGNGATVTLYDALSATNDIGIIAPPNNIYPGGIVYELDFYVGLTITITGTVDLTVIYE